MRLVEFINASKALEGIERSFTGLLSRDGALNDS